MPVPDLNDIVSDLRANVDPQFAINRLQPLAAIADEEYFRRQRFKPLREAWAAAHFGRALQLLGHDVLVKIAPENAQFPDFYLTLDGCEYPFEFTEALLRGRRRDDEYREAAQRPAGLCDLIVPCVPRTARG